MVMEASVAGAVARPVLLLMVFLLCSEELRCWAAWLCLCSRQGVLEVVCGVLLKQPE